MFTLRILSRLLSVRNGHGDEAVEQLSLSCLSYTNSEELYDNGEAFDVGRSLCRFFMLTWFNGLIRTFDPYVKSTESLGGYKSNRYESLAGSIYIIYVLQFRGVSAGLTSR